MNLYIIETVYHLFLTLIVVENNNFNILIVDSHRYQTLNAVQNLDFIINRKFEKIIYVHKYKQIGAFSNVPLIKQIIYYLRMTYDVKKILQQTKTNEYKNLYVFTTNHIERILINAIDKTESNNNIFLIEEGIGSYTDIRHILGKDSSTSISNRGIMIYNIMRKLSNTPISIAQFKELYFVFPDLVDRTISSKFKVIKTLKENNSIAETRLLISKYYLKNNELKKNSNKSLHLFSKLNDEFEKKFNEHYFSNYQIGYKLHPSKMEKSDDNFLLNTSIELLSLVDPFMILISYASSSAISLLSLDLEFTTKFIFLFKIYHSKNVRFASDKQLKFIFRLKRKFPEKIFIPNNSDELYTLLEKYNSIA